MDHPRLSLLQPYAIAGYIASFTLQNRPNIHPQGPRDAAKGEKEVQKIYIIQDQIFPE